MANELERFADARILVLDDNVDNLDLMAAVLSRAGAKSVHTESKVLEVSSLLAVTDPDLVVLDLHMPHVDGFAVLREVIAYAAGSYLPVLVVSADISRAAMHRALQGGAQDFVTKPFDNFELLLRVRNLLETRYLRRTLRAHTVYGKNGGLPRLPEQQESSFSQRRERVEEVLRPGGFWMALQPIIDTETSQTIGFEALARFAGVSQRAPDQWFAEAAEVGLGVELELAAVSLAVASMEAIQARAPGAFLAINASPSAVLSGELDALLPSEICPYIVLELTEHTPVENYDTVLHAAAELRRRGLRLAVDDTGAGYAGFRHLLSLQPDIIKLDISLTRGVDTLPSHRALASALVVFASAVGARLLAEGVETGAEADTLRELGIGWMQGYHFGRPTAELEATAGAR